ncbi:TPA: glycosyltransferase family 4 protein, partial [Escherichia coli]
VEGIANFYICGNGFEKYKALNSTNVNVSGYIDSLDDFYNEMDVMIFPIFSGAGMKVKIAESLMYNKPILASAFALVGYEKIIDGTNVISCESHESFVYHIRQFRRDNNTLYNRKSYYKYFSDKACLHYFRNILREIVNNE